MGQPKRQRKKYEGPSHLWQKERIEKEKILLKEFALKNKREIWREGTIAKSIAINAKKLIADTSSQALLERKQLLERGKRLGLLKSDSLDDALDTTLEDVLNRRIATIVFKKGMARTIKQARQMVVHGHISIDGKKITSPSYLVSLEEENKVMFAENSPFANPQHPERLQEKDIKK